MWLIFICIYLLILLQIGDEHGVSFKSEKKISFCDELLKELEHYLLPKCNTNTKVVVTTKVNSNKTPSSHSRVSTKISIIFN